ncbi:MAG: (P)ppGpp synthetase [Parcubacteria group bacterium GW2011_GWC1_42_11]|uniref:(P)ppGpp synthetase n=1 Tax=Candidatus Nomurabacteria bacterium GW2011_GWC2_42_20 TaxID=1618756 RepID=A0A0G1CEZ9_9BACT|nr:MAG: (P)ppGpp synthetase [Parcubacteria group bacterium GW2011_GWC1_42_11]KKS48113.1 MAG: (P)ppGpp synthetase [Candidatus Nomurabacteria bacterium GW2011_GWC2_42_20]KKS58425.1 MAG: (P)ppGpp synthetase [Candidatus Nomurabacteria bacterium GW2011_GWA2_42_41]KKT09229.1 MAG: (P)ppGpp synthetase [Candidatus Nomurabacteria bacterium GW2011_GWB1_43_20]TAN36879.1 MAG: bifunctional (p)ppGpp synthetase/guanosine-3',5'-bis(diphosphate) 3'-pyrophosphohydrolase [Patescibacteria group bacterium]HBH71443.
MLPPKKIDSCPSIKEIISLLKNPTKDDIALIEKAYAFAKTAHEGQKRYSGEPYFLHVASVGKTLSAINIDATTIAAGILHDTIEDAEIPARTIEKEFGKEVLSLVEGVTKLGKLKYHGVERHVESLRKFFIAMSHDVRVLLIKLADRLHNIQTLEHVPEAKRHRIALETLEVHARLADRFGMGKWKAIFEDSAFPYAYPKEYEQVLALIKNKRVVDEKYAEKIHRSIQKELAANGIKTARVDYRVKNLFSLWKKLARKEMDPDKVYDILAVRVIVKTVEDCYKTLGIIHKHWRPVSGRIKDYIATPKSNGYKSLHTTIFRGDGGIIEIQIRTEEMHAEAQYGIASHLAYKEKGSIHGETERNLAWVKELAKWQKEVARTDDFMEHLHMDFFKNRTFVYTPKGDVIDLPEDSSPIDFAYAIHSNIGNHLAGAKINGKLVSIETKLTNGDIVEIETKESASPKRKWLDYTKTTLAKRHIRTYLEKSNPIELLAQKFFGKKK